jgi:hypothetical protein
VIALDRGRVELMTADAFGRRFAEVTIPGLPFMGVCTVAVASLAGAEEALGRGRLVARRHGEGLLVRFPEALGTGGWLFSDAQGPVWRPAG